MSKNLKSCVFCGQEVQSKTKEHVIPRWLMQITGDSKRQAYFQVFRPQDDGRHKRFSFDSYHFPACDKCNNDFSKLENKAKEVIGKILEKAPLAAVDWTVLLDWLDKVRIGTWLGTRSLDKNYVPVDPLFHIADRIGTKDRSVLITRARQGQRLSFFGGNSLAARFMPSCFGILINDIGLLNVSHEFLLSRRLGFPFSEDLTVETDRFRSYVPVPGRERIMRPPLKLPITRQGTAIHQCIFKDWQNSTASELWQSEYVSSNSYDHKKGISSPFLEKENGAVSQCTDLADNAWIPTHVFESTALAGQYLARYCIDLQKMLWEPWPSLMQDNAKRKEARIFVNMLNKELEDIRSAIKNMQ